MSAPAVATSDQQEQYLAWKRLVPYMYDWFANHNLTWPSLSCRRAPPPARPMLHRPAAARATNANV